MSKGCSTSGSILGCYTRTQRLRGVSRFQHGSRSQLTDWSRAMSGKPPRLVTRGLQYRNYTRKHNLSRRLGVVPQRIHEHVGRDAEAPPSPRSLAIDERGTGDRSIEREPVRRRAVSLRSGSPRRAGERPQLWPADKIFTPRQIPRRIQQRHALGRERMPSRALADLRARLQAGSQPDRCS